MSLIGHWRLEDYSDSVSNNDLEIVNDTGGLLVDAGRFGAAYSKPSLNSSLDHLKAKNQVRLSGDFTMACWAKVTDAGASANGLLSFHDHSNYTGSGLNVKYISSTDYRLTCSTADGTSRTYHTHYGTANIYNRWAHLVVRYDSENQLYSLWVDGVKDYEFSYNQYNVPDDFRIFNWSNSYMSLDYRPGCIIDDVRLFDHAVSEREIRDMALGLFSHIHPVNVDGNLVYDQSGQGNDMDMGSGTPLPSVTEDSPIGRLSFEFNDGETIRDDINQNVLNMGVHSCSMWVKFFPEAIAAESRFYWHGNYGALVRKGSLDEFVAYLRTDVGTYQCNSNGIVTAVADRWYHVGQVYDGSTLKLYVDGEYISETSGTGTVYANANESRIELGAHANWPTHIQMTDIRSYHGVLTDADMKDLYQRRASIDSVGNLFAYDTIPAYNRKGAEEDIFCTDANISVVAYEDNTNVYVNGTLQTTINKQVRTVLTNAIGDIVSSDKPITTGTAVNGVPLGWAGKRFMMSMERYDPSTVYVYAPYEDAVVNVYRSDAPTTIIETLNITQGTYATSSGVSTFRYIFESDVDVVAYFHAGSDASPLYPAGTEFHGVPSGGVDVMSLEDGNAITVYHSDGLITQTNMNRGGVWNTGGGSGSQYSGRSQTVISTKPVAVWSQADGDGGETAPYVPKEAFSSEFILPEDSEFVVFVGRVPQATVDVYDNTGAYIDTKTVGSNSGGGEYFPTKLRILASEETYSLLAGYKFVCSEPQYALFENLTSDRETILYGTGRTYSPKFNVSTQGEIEGDVSEVSVMRGIEHWYPFNGDVLDYVGNNTTSAVVATPQHRGYSLDGQLGTYIDIGSQVMKKEGATLAFWLKVVDSTAHGALFSIQIDGNFESLIEFRSNQMFCETDVNCNTFSSPAFNPAVGNNEWHHYAVVFDMQKAYWYQNGVLLGETADYGTINCDDLNPASQLEGDLTMRYIAGTAYNPVVNGTMADVRIYNSTALSAQEIANIYNTTDPSNPNRMSHGMDKLYIKKQLKEVNL